MFVCLGLVVLLFYIGYWSVSGWLVYLFCVVFTSFITLQHKTRQRQGGSLINCMDTYFHIHNISDALNTQWVAPFGELAVLRVVYLGSAAALSLQHAPAAAVGQTPLAEHVSPTGNHCLLPTLRLRELQPLLCLVAAQCNFWGVVSM